MTEWWSAPRDDPASLDISAPPSHKYARLDPILGAFITRVVRFRSLNEAAGWALSAPPETPTSGCLEKGGPRGGVRVERRHTAYASPTLMLHFVWSHGWTVFSDTGRDISGS